MRPFLFIATIVLVAGLQNAVPQKHTEATHPQTQSHNGAANNMPQTQVINVGSGRQLGNLDEAAKTSTSQQRAPKWWDRPTITDWILATTTLVYVIVNIFMLIAIKRQSSATMDADCALILIQWHNMVHLDPEVENGVLHHCFQWSFRNAGKTPAFIQKVHSRFIVIDKLSDLPPIPVYTKPKELSYESEPLLPDKVFEPAIYSPIESQLAYAELDAAHRAKKCFLYAYGFVTYKDVYGRQQETRFGIVYDSHITPSLVKDRFRIVGPPAYNRYKNSQP